MRSGLSSVRSGSAGPASVLKGNDAKLHVDMRDSRFGRLASPAATSRCAFPRTRKKIQDKTAAGRSLHAMLERPAQRLTVGDADVLEGGVSRPVRGRLATRARAAVSRAALRAPARARR